MNKKRLMDLANVLKTVKRKEFDMRCVDCGTAACAVGHYIRRFPQRGLGKWDNWGVHFGISENVADALFCTGANLSPLQVRCRVLSYIRNPKAFEARVEFQMQHKFGTSNPNATSS
jgi:hypothetical protein